MGKYLLPISLHNPLSQFFLFEIFYCLLVVSFLHQLFKQIIFQILVRFIDVFLDDFELFS